ncbi:ankyrin repeat-containing domain protein [Aspergillus carlsbadensis]|nr:ankyrin repeat-containing domain protein [Aspergillus carlsbadensis]
MDSLAPELLLQITTHLKFTRDIAALARTSRTLHEQLNDLIYAHNTQHENASGLERAVELNIAPAVSKLLTHGAAPKLPGPRFIPILTETATRQASLEIIRMLRQQSIDSPPESPLPRCTPDWMVTIRGTPLSGAIEPVKYTNPRYMAHYRDAPLLDQAIRHDRVDVVRMLIGDVGLDPSIHGDAALFCAARWGGPELVRVLLEAGCEVNARYARATGTAVHAAVSVGKVENILVLMQAGADLEAWDGVGGAGTPLCLAAKMGVLEVVEVLVEAGALVDPQAVKGVALVPLLCAAEGGHAAVVEYLLRKIDVDRIIHGETPQAEAGRLALLTISSILGHTDLAQRILATGHDVNRLPQQAHYLTPTRSALSFAADTGHIQLVKLFLPHGANPGPQCNSEYEPFQPLARAADRGHEAIVRLLIDAGAPVDVPVDSAGVTILQAAAGNTGIAQLLLDYGATPSLALVLAALSGGNVALVGQLLARGFSLRGNGDSGSDSDDADTTLLTSAANGGPTALSFLLDEHGVTPDPAIPANAAPLEYLIRSGDLETVEYCLSTASRHSFTGVFARNASRLLCAAVGELYDEELVEMLEVLIAALALFSDSDTGEEYRRALTDALHVAIPRYELAAVYLLLENGADLDWRGGGAENAWEVACRGGDRDVLDMFLEHAHSKLGEDLDAFRRFILPIEQRARAAGQGGAVKAISYFYYRRRYPQELSLAVGLPTSA